MTKKKYIIIALLAILALLLAAYFWQCGIGSGPYDPAYEKAFCLG